MPKAAICYYVYLLKCADDTFYCGMTTDPARRLDEHNHSPKGARYTSARRPVQMLWLQNCANRSEALRLEALLKRQTHHLKAELCGYSSPE